MKRYQANAGIAFAVAICTVTAVLGLRIVGTTLSRPATMAQSRIELVEAVSVSCSELLASGRTDGLEPMLRSLVSRNSFASRNEQVASAVCKDSKGRVVAHARDAGQVSLEKDSGAASDNVLVLPLVDDGKRRGTLELRFRSGVADQRAPTWSLPSVEVAVIVLVANLLGCYFVCRSRPVVAESPRDVQRRARAALDALVEGVVLLDGRLRIHTANRVFAEAVGRNPNDLPGRRISEFLLEPAETTKILQQIRREDRRQGSNTTVPSSTTISLHKSNAGSCSYPFQVSRLSGSGRDPAVYLLTLNAYGASQEPQRDSGGYPSDSGGAESCNSEEHPGLDGTGGEMVESITEHEGRAPDAEVEKRLQMTTSDSVSMELDLCEKERAHPASESRRHVEEEDSQDDMSDANEPVQTEPVRPQEICEPVIEPAATSIEPDCSIELATLEQLHELLSDARRAGRSDFQLDEWTVVVDSTIAP